MDFTVKAVSQMPELVHHFQVIQFPHGFGGNLCGGHPVEVADAPEPDEDHAEEVLVEDDEVAADPLRLVVQVAGHLAHAPEQWFSLEERGSTYVRTCLNFSS